ncbi:hypothetical protein WISP_11049 [Willisornis vidua]|uniref:Uncharacterized protein n=1 Tax=Willisornis vidua TaxID=1566151 RepID=A0ABQ9DWV9_9PASS|nr:hypothetical protein WISP_11049 [Willisornis vidua]
MSRLSSGSVLRLLRGGLSGHLQAAQPESREGHEAQLHPDRGTELSSIRIPARSSAPSGSLHEAQLHPDRGTELSSIRTAHTSVDRVQLHSDPCSELSSIRNRAQLRAQSSAPSGPLTLRCTELRARSLPHCSQCGADLGPGGLQRVPRGPAQSSAPLLQTA